MSRAACVIGVPHELAKTVFAVTIYELCVSRLPSPRYPMSIVEQFELALTSNLFLAYGLAFVGGLLDCLTPCSAFATPVALGYFSGLNPNIPRRKIGMLTGTFALSVSAMYSLMGLLAAWIGGAVFAWLGTSPWPYLVVGVFLLYLVAVSANLLPVWATPAFLRQTSVRDFGGKQGTYKGAAAIGFGVALMMGPCAAPVLTTILYVVAAKHDLLFGVTLLLAFSLGISSFMVFISLTGRRAVKYLAGIGKIRGHVGKVVDVLILIVAVLIIYKGVDNFLTYGMAADPDQTNTIAANDPAELNLAPLFFTLGELKEEEALEKGRLIKGVKMPHAGLKGSDEITSIADMYKSSWLFVTFWGTWCKECIEEIPAIKNMQADPWTKNRLTILAVDVMEDRGAVEPFAKKNGITYPILIDPDGDLVDHLGVFAYPYNLLIAPNGDLVYAGGKFPAGYRSIIEAHPTP